MAVVTRETVAEQPDLQRETVPVPSLGGEVIVTELSLSDRLDFEQVLREDFDPQAEATGVSPAGQKPRGKGASRRSVHAMVPQLLAITVLDAQDRPLFTAKEWQAFGARNRDAAIELFNVAMRLSGFNGDDSAKN